jgi:hypothetical protein
VLLRIDEYLETLPENVLSGEDVQLPEKSLRNIFKFAGLEKDDIFYHLGCGDEKGIEIAVKEFQVKKAVGIDKNCEKIENAKKKLKGEPTQMELRCQDVLDSEISDATVILFWFTNESITNQMLKKFESLKSDTKIITIWGPLPECIPDKVDFPYIINKVPFRKAKNIQEQLLNDRFLTIIQTLVIWINAKKLGVACGDEIPESIQTYIKLMKMNFDIDFEPMLKEQSM